MDELIKTMKEKIEQLEEKNMKEIKNNSILYDKNKKLQKDLLKANEELDQY